MTFLLVHRVFVPACIVLCGGGRDGVGLSSTGSASGGGDFGQGNVNRDIIRVRHFVGSFVGERLKSFSGKSFGTVLL